MILYLIVIGVCIFVMSGILAPIYHIHYFVLVGQICLATVFEIAVAGLVAAVSRCLPKKCANYEKKIFTVSAKEKKFYEKIYIRKWKEKIPEIGHFTGFRKNKIADPKSEEYLQRFLMEICYGEIGHFFGLFFGFAIMLFFPFFDMKDLFFIITSCIAAINILLTLPTIFVLRYNSYKLSVLLKNLQKRKKRETGSEKITA